MQTKPTLAVSLLGPREYLCGTAVDNAISWDIRRHWQETEITNVTVQKESENDSPVMGPVLGPVISDHMFIVRKDPR